MEVDSLAKIADSLVALTPDLPPNCDASMHPFQLRKPHGLIRTPRPSSWHGLSLHALIPHLFRCQTTLYHYSFLPFSDYSRFLCTLLLTIIDLV